MCKLNSPICRRTRLEKSLVWTPFFAVCSLIPRLLLPTWPWPYRESGTATALLEVLSNPNHASDLNHRGNLLQDFVHLHNLFVVSLSSVVSGPQYTFFSGNSQTMVDYILLESSNASQVKGCHVHQHHPLNLSDHLPVSVSLELNSMANPTPTNHPKAVNWSLAIERGDVHAYAQEISSVISPLLHTSHQSISELYDEVTFVCQALLDAARNNLPYKTDRKRKPYIRDAELKVLCKNSKVAWKAWSEADRPSSGPLLDEKEMQGDWSVSLSQPLKQNKYAQKYRNVTSCSDKTTVNDSKLRSKKPNAKSS